jgi:Flp pilus assembly protein TadD
MRPERVRIIIGHNAAGPAIYQGDLYKGDTMLCRFCLPRCALLALACLSILAESFYSQIRPPARNSAVNGEPDYQILVRSAFERFGITLDDLTTQLKVSPADPVLLNNLAVLYAAENRLDDALETGLRSVSLNGGIAATRMNLAVIYDRLGQTERARQEAGFAAALDPKDFRIRSCVCELELALRHDREAADCYRRVLAEFPPQTETRLKLGAALIRSGQLIDAKTVLEQARAEEPNDPEILSVLANAHFRLKEFDQSTALLKAAVERHPDDARLRYNLGISYLALKNRAAALSQYNLIKETSPELAGKLYRSLFHRFILEVGR